MAKKILSAIVNMCCTAEAELVEEMGCVLASLRGPNGERTDGKTFRLDLAEFKGMVPEQFDGINVELTFDKDEDRQTGKYRIPASFKIVGDIEEGKYADQSEPDDVEAYLRDLGII